MGVQPPAELHLTAHRDARFMLFPAAVLGLFLVTAWLGSKLFGDPELEAAGVEADDIDWVVPMLGIGGMVAVTLVLWAAFAVGSRWTERRKVRRVYEHALASWPQYASGAQWQKAITRDDEPDGGLVDVLVPAGILTVVVGGLAVWFGVEGIWTPAFVLGGFLCAGLGMVAGRQWIGERDRRANQARRRRITPYPACVLAEFGLYHEDSGLIEIDTVTDVRLIPASQVSTVRKRLRAQARDVGMSIDLDPFDYRLARSGWSLLQFTLDSGVMRTWGRRILDTIGDETGDRMTTTSVFGIRVPPGREEEAISVIAAVEHRWLSGRRGLFRWVPSSPGRGP